jgi:hypothetical protein
MTKRKKQTIQKIVETGPRHARQAAFDAMVAQEHERQIQAINHYTCQLVQSFKVEGLNTPTILSTLFSTMLYFLGEDQSKDKTRSMEDYFQPEVERFRANLAERMAAIRSGEIVFDPIPLPADPDADSKERPN